jgi:hypothetical protein
MVLAIASGILRAVTLDKTVHLWAHLAVALSLGLAAARSFFTTPLFRATAFVVFLATFSLTEMALVAPLLLALLREATADDSRSERWLAFALPIVRVDLCVVPLAMALVSRDRRGARLALAALAGIAVQLATMKLAFGEFVSVAALLKTTNSFASITDNLRANLFGSVFQSGLLLAHGVLVAIALRTKPDRATWLLVSASLAFVATHTLLSVLRGWYLLPSTLALLFTVERSPGKIGRIAAAMLTLAFVTRAVRAELVYRDDQLVAATFVSELRARVPPGSRIYTWDNPGFLGFFSGLRVVDGDGLVNDYDYARRLRDGTLQGYLEEHLICHVVVADADDDPVLDVPGHTLRRADVEPLYVIRRKLSSQSDFALYRIVAERCR